MRILLVHNAYRQRGGEDAVYETERELLRQAGHDVAEFHVSNDEVAAWDRVRLALGTVWSRSRARALRAAVQRHRPDVAHFHNTLPLISPSGYWAVGREGVAVVQTLHNYRLLCPSALLFRDGQVCEDCVGRKIAWPAVRHACYRQSRAASATVAAMLAVHRLLGTWRQRIDVYVAMTRFAREKFVSGGLPEERIAVKPNFLADDPGVGSESRRGVLFVGRLSTEKGVSTLLRAVDHLPDEIEVRVIGDGPLATSVARRAARDPRIRFDGPKDRDGVIAAMQSAEVLVFPSVWYEGANPVTIVEAFSTGLPVLASRIGGMVGLVQPGHNGELFEPGDSVGLAAALRASIADPDRLAAMSSGARNDFVTHYSAPANLRTLERIYEVAIEARRSGAAPRIDAALRGEGPRRRKTAAVPLRVGMP